MKKYFNNPKTVEELRKQYTDLMKKFHPDNGGTEEDAKEINAEYDLLFARLKNIHESKTETDAGKESETYNTDIDQAIREAIDKIIGLDGIEIEIRGCWVWVSGNTYSVKEQLKAAGFKWCKDKKEWQFHTGTYRKHSSHKMTAEEIREKYGCQTIKTQPRMRIA